ATVRHRKAQVVLASEVEPGDGVPSRFGRHGEDARLRGPRIEPTGGLRQPDLVADVIGVLQLGEEIVAGHADRVVVTGAQWPPNLDQTAADITIEPVPARCGRPRRVPGPDTR